MPEVLHQLPLGGIRALLHPFLIAIAAPAPKFQQAFSKTNWLNLLNLIVNVNPASALVFSFLDQADTIAVLETAFKKECNNER